VGSETHEVRSDADVVRIRQLVRAASVDLGFGLVDQTKIVTAASEIARNTLEYGGGGTMRIDPLSEGPRRGLRLVFEDRGPGIADIARALEDGHTTGKGLGLGLGGARRLVSEFAIESEVGKGTRVTLLKWR
jgi:serine/threonine-protein kinase RsbT